ncbi:hypothetical protein EFR01_42040 [Sinorhizobium fredii]|nr:hypothetical protein EFR01_42040 [Sinorhizobium fredii]
METFEITGNNGASDVRTHGIRRLGSSPREIPGFLGLRRFSRTGRFGILGFKTMWTHYAAMGAEGLSVLSTMAQS